MYYGKLTINNSYVGECEYSHELGGTIPHKSSMTGRKDLVKVIPESFTISGLDISLHNKATVSIEIDGDEGLIVREGVIVQKNKLTCM